MKTIKEQIYLDLTEISSEGFGVIKHTYEATSTTKLPMSLNIEIEREPKNVSEFIEVNKLKESEVLEYLNKKINKLK